jgi:heptosyltransferase-1
LDIEGLAGLMNILIIKLSAVGDVVHTLPALAALRKLYPQAHITWVIEEAAADLIAGHPYIDRVVIFPRKRWMKEFRQGRIGDVFRDFKTFLHALRHRPYDMVLDFHGLFKSAVLVGMSGGRRKLGYDSLQEFSGLFYSEKIPEDMSKHAVDRYLDFLTYLGANPGKPVFSIPILQENIDQVSSLLRNNGIEPGEQPFVAINPVALWNTKLWNKEKFAELSVKIIEDLKLPVVLTGSMKEQSYLGHIQTMMARPAINLAGRTSLRDLAYLYRLAELVVTTDSGPMHIAAAMETPVVALFGPTDPARTGPYGDGHVVIRQSLSCSPCFLKQCSSHRCMEDISANEVFEVVKKRLGEIKDGKKEGKGGGK